MALLFFSSDYEKLYNCTFYDYNVIPVENRVNIFRGCLSIISNSVIWTLYIPCLIAMCDSKLLKNSCYKLMLIVGFLDLNTTIFTGFWSGIVDFTGTVFCASPTLVYWMGCGNILGWKIQSTATVLLAFNRCVYVYDEKLGEKLFKGWRTFLWMLLPIAWAGTDFFIGKPTIYNSLVSSSYYPHSPYFSDTKNQYENKAVIYNNAFCSIFIVLTYSLCGLFLWIKMKKSNQKNFKLQTKVFGQILLLSLFLFFCSTGHLLVQFMQMPILFKQILTYSFILVNGQPAVIYLTLNPYIRNKVLCLLGLRKETQSSRVVKISITKA